MWDYASIVSAAAGAQFLSFESLPSADDADRSLSGSGGTYFIQVSHYGYQRRGVPMRLLRWTREQKLMGARIGFFFHELFAFGAPWRSSFWLSPLQRYITREMARLSDFWMTYGQSSARWLLRAGGDKRHKVLPVFSNMGEAPLFEKARAGSLVVCGNPGLRQETYRLAGTALFDWSARLGLTIHDVGAPLTGDIREQLARRGVREHGRLARDDVSRLLSEAMYGLVAYPVPYIAKSGVFAAYCAHGVCPLLISQSHVSLDGVVPDRHYRVWPRGEIEARDDDRLVGRHAFEWYASHNISSHADALLRLASTKSATPSGDARDVQ